MKSMLRFRTILAGCSLLQVFAVALAAQDRGAIRGRVADGIGNSLSRASVRLEQLDRTAFTDERGEFHLPEVPAGSHRLTASFLGYADVQGAVEVRAGDTAVVNLTLGADVVRLDRMVIQSTRDGQARALTQQRNAGHLMTVVSADAVGKFPDAYVGDALRRLVGVVVEEDQGEATGVTVRGIEPDYNNITINGLEVAATGTPGGGTSNQASRPVPLDIFSVDVIEAIEVAKATTPDMDGAGLGGAVNVRTKTAFSRGARELAATAEYTHADLGAGSDGYRGTASYSDIFGRERKFGLLAALTHEKRDRIVEKVYGTQYNASGVLQRSRANGYRQTLTRTSLLANLDYKVAPGTVVSLKSTYSDYDDESGYNRAQIHADQGRYQNEFVRDHRFKKLASLDLGVESRIGRNLLRLGGLYSYSDEDKPENQKHVFRTANNAVRVTFDQSDWISPYPILSTFADTNGLPATAADKALFTLNEAKFRGNYQEETRWTWYVDYARDLEARGHPVKLKLGAKYTTHTKRNNAWSYVFSPSSTVLNYNYFPDQPPTQIRAHWQVYNLDKSRMLALYNGPDRDTYLRYSPQGSVSDGVVEDFSADEWVAAVYTSLVANIRRLRLEGGVRYEQAEGKFTNYGYDESAYNAIPTAGAFVGYSVDPVSAYPNVIKVVPGQGSFSNFLPSLHTRYPVTPNLVVRSAISTNVGRPKFTDLAGLATFRASNNPDGSAFTLTTGNPDLKAATSTNFDLTFSYYGLKPLGLLELGGFYKEIANRVYREVTIRPATQQDYDRYRTATNGLDVGDLIDVVSRGNAKTTKVYGLEADWRMELRFLPGPFKGLGVGANYTYAESEETIPFIQTLPATSRSQPARAGQKVAFPLQARHSGSGFVSFQKSGFDGRVAGTFTGRRLASWSDSNPANDQYWRARWRVDVICAYTFNRRWSINVSVINLTDDPAVLYTNPSRLINSEFYGRTGRLAVRYFFR
jgi:TonB-dependent receptor